MKLATIILALVIVLLAGIANQSCNLAAAAAVSSEVAKDRAKVLGYPLKSFMSEWRNMEQAKKDNPNCTKFCNYPKNPNGVGGNKCCPGYYGNEAISAALKQLGMLQ